MLKSLEEFIELLDTILVDENRFFEENNPGCNVPTEKTSRMEYLVSAAKQDQLKYTITIKPTLTITFHVYLFQKYPAVLESHTRWNLTNAEISENESFVRVIMSLNPKFIDNQAHICVAWESSEIQSWVAYNTTSKLIETIRNIILRLDQLNRLFD